MVFPITEEEWPAIGGGPCVVTIQFHLRQQGNNNKKLNDHNRTGQKRTMINCHEYSLKLLLRALTSSLKGSRCGSHQKTSLVGAVDKGWGESSPQKALTNLCASLKSLQP